MPPPRMLKGLARAVRGGRVIERKHSALSRDAEEAIFSVATVISEGSIDKTNQYFGSTMMTIDLVQLQASWRTPLDALERERLLRAVEGSVRVRVRAMRIARTQAIQRSAGNRIGTVRTEMRVFLQGTKLHLDIDLEAKIGVSSSRSGT